MHFPFKSNKPPDALTQAFIEEARQWVNAQLQPCAKMSPVERYAHLLELEPWLQMYQDNHGERLSMQRSDAYEARSTRQLKKEGKAALALFAAATIVSFLAPPFIPLGTMYNGIVLLCMPFLVKGAYMFARMPSYGKPPPEYTKAYDAFRTDITQRLDELEQNHGSLLSRSLRGRDDFPTAHSARLTQLFNRQSHPDEAAVDFCSGIHSTLHTQGKRLTLQPKRAE